MPAKDFYHETVKNALLKDGWQITHDPLRLSWGGKDMYIDLAANYSLLAADRARQHLAVEIKSFLGHSLMNDLEKAVGQYVIYRAVLAERDPQRQLYLAVPQRIIWSLFDQPLGQLLFKHQLVKVTGVNTHTEEIVQWLP